MLRVFQRLRLGRLASTPASASSGGPSAGSLPPLRVSPGAIVRDVDHNNHHHSPGGFFQNPHPHDHVEVSEEVPDVIYGPFGTIDKPSIVKSAFAERIVGCLGRSSEDGHVLLWHNVNNKKPTICVECGQVFKLKTVGISASHGHGAHAETAHTSHGHGITTDHGHATNTKL